MSGEHSPGSSRKGRSVGSTHGSDAAAPTAVVKNRYHHGDLKRALTEAALALVAEKGPRGFTLTEAARRAGVSSAAPYRHFADKESLLATVAAQGFHDLATAVEDGATGARDPINGMLRMAVAYVGWAVEHPAQYRVMLGSGLEKTRYPELQAAAERSFGGLIAVIESCQADGVLDPGDPRRFAGPMWSLVHGVASLALDDDLRQVGLTEPVTELAERTAGDWLSAVRRDTTQPG